MLVRLRPRPLLLGLELRLVGPGWSLLRRLELLDVREGGGGQLAEGAEGLSSLAPSAPAPLAGGRLTRALAGAGPGRGGVQGRPPGVEELRAGLHGREESLAVLDEYFYHFVAELDVHDGGHRLLSRPDESGTEHHAQVGGRHEVLVTPQRDFIQMTN